MHVHEQRMALGLTQAQLAKLAGLSRATVIHREKAAWKILVFTKLNNLLSLLGMNFDATPRIKKILP
jgi:DNA-binding XRE family transcriptional regulator